MCISLRLMSFRYLATILHGSFIFSIRGHPYHVMSTGWMNSGGDLSIQRVHKDEMLWSANWSSIFEKSSRRWQNISMPRRMPTSRSYDDRKSRYCACLVYILLALDAQIYRSKEASSCPCNPALHHHRIINELGSQVHRECSGDLYCIYSKQSTTNLVV